MQRYVCDICGYIYDPSVGDVASSTLPGVALQDLPDDWLCPVCGVGVDFFSEI